jgi:hypothetical protein
MVALTFCAFMLTVLADVAGQQGLNSICLATHIIASVVLFSAIPLTHLCSAMGYAAVRFRDATEMFILDRDYALDGMASLQVAVDA